MSIAINGMEMPISCPHCPCSDDESRFCRAANKYIPMLGKPEFCPLVTIEERKTGKWIMGKCDQCGAHAPFWPMASTYYESDFCPNCGSEMM